ncbi:MoaD/ThiS family protein [Pontimicrobium aquaticum]|uniref:MoaD/ThiS family protein n=1 Tax=Pontimicrobium aquaticum TaxID=2565367 RepID=A0A4U0ESD4_9FLAO|nr:MoaD/ThiS family protein [Pontimicrobium aquaticum]TJY34653.1 MoaD/ThiS family protein [Pontimicrobium aquaticum]
MQLQIKYFGLLAEITNCEGETIEFSKTSVSDLLEELYIKYPLLKQKDFKVAQNYDIVSNSSEITNPEIALLPPFSGG